MRGKIEVSLSLFWYNIYRIVKDVYTKSHPTITIVKHLRISKNTPIFTLFSTNMRDHLISLFVIAKNIRIDAESGSIWMRVPASAEICNTGAKDPRSDRAEDKGRSQDAIETHKREQRVGILTDRWPDCVPRQW